jgi:hypothetical protein
MLPVTIFIEDICVRETKIIITTTNNTIFLKLSGSSKAGGQISVSREGRDGNLCSFAKEVNYTEPPKPSVYPE